MSLLFETIRVENGCVMYPRWHEARMAASRLELWNLNDPVCLNEIIRIPEEFSTGVVRCRITYGPHPVTVTFEKYLRRPVQTLKLVECGHIDYHLKRDDRSELEELLSKKGNCDEIIIVRAGFITDTSISNLIFFNGEKWHTPDTPLLKGVCRQRLLKEGKISESRIHPEDLQQFSGIKMINALRYPDEEDFIPVSSISL